MKYFFIICIFFCIASCSDKKPESVYPVIDLVNSVEKYQRVYCSDLFSSIELIPLETKNESIFEFRNIKIKDNIIFIQGKEGLYAFDRSGSFLNSIGRKGKGPGEYGIIKSFSLNTDNSTVFVEDYVQILEFDFKGNFIRAFKIPEIENDGLLGRCSYVGDGLFIGNIIYNGKNKYKYCLFNGNGEIVKCFPSYIFYEKKDRMRASRLDDALPPIRVDNRLYFKDYINDTIYNVENSNLKSAYVFDLGKYTIPIRYLELFDMQDPIPTNAFQFLNIVGTPKYFFYEIVIPEIFSQPKPEKIFDPRINDYVIADYQIVSGIYNIEKKTNIMLDTDANLQRGIVNDINGGFPVIPKFYAGNEIIDVWKAHKMKEKLTDEYFSKQTIKDKAGRQKLKELLKNMKEDDNEVVVIAKLK